MINSFFRDVYLKVRISGFLARLESIDQRQYRVGDDEYRGEMSVLCADLASFADAQVDNFPASAVGRVCAAEAGLLQKIRLNAAKNTAEEEAGLPRRVSVFLDRMYDAVNSARRTNTRFRNPAVIVVPIIVICFAAAAYAPLKKQYKKERSEYEAVANEDLFRQKTLEDILALQQALAKYYNDHKSYPKSSGGWDAIHAMYGQSTEDWIPGLAPDYIKELPVDPRQLEDPLKQYMYKSDGKDYKLIAHYPTGFSEITQQRPELADPRRPSWAYGVWTDGARDW